MEYTFLIDVVAALAACALWYWFFVRYNRRRGVRVLRSLEAACRTRGKILGHKWLDVNRLQIKLGFAAHWFENARVTVSLRPRPFPLHWLFAIWKSKKEVLTFEADLGGAPSHHVHVFRHHWLNHAHTAKSIAGQDWELHRPSPVLLTSRPEWSNDLSPVVTALMTSGGHRLLSVRLRPESPNLAATLPLDAVGDATSASSFLKVLRALAEGASARQQ